MSEQNELFPLSPPLKYICRTNDIRKYYEREIYKNMLGELKTEKKENYYSFQNDFTRDRNRISNCKSYLRLAGKTQIFYANSSDDNRNRFTHTTEVSQLARTVARVLLLDVDLAEAIAVGHDVGHTPFGHEGEDTLNKIMNQCDETLHGMAMNGMAIDDDNRGFRHNMQSVRALVDLERYFNKVPGLNLTNFTLYGIWNHTTAVDEKICISRSDHAHPGVVSSAKRITCVDNPVIKPLCPNQRCKKFHFYNKYKKYMQILPNIISQDVKEQYKKQPVNTAKSEETEPVFWSWSFESSIVRICDEIAQRHHDLEDGILTNIISIEEVVENIENFFHSKNFKEIDQKNFSYLKTYKARHNKKLFLYHLGRFIVNFYTNELITNSRASLLSFIERNSITKTNWVNVYPKIDVRDIDGNANNPKNPNNPNNIINFSDEFKICDKEMHRFLERRILSSQKVHMMDGVGSGIITGLFQAYLGNPKLISDKGLYQLFKTNRFTLVDDLWKRDGKEDQDSSSDAESSEKHIPETGKIIRKHDDSLTYAKIISKIREDELKNFLSEDKSEVLLLRCICDYIAGMTDSYAVLQYSILCGYNPLSM
jgi:dGTPase